MRPALNAQSEVLLNVESKDAFFLIQMGKLLIIFFLRAIFKIHIVICFYYSLLFVF